jgi:hypothetical protein
MEAMRTAQLTMFFVYETIPLYYVHNVIDRHADQELFADDDWHWLKSAVQVKKLDVTSAGLW